MSRNLFAGLERTIRSGTGFFTTMHLGPIRLTVLLLFVTSMAFGVQEQRKLTLSGSNITIQKVFQTIKKRTGLTVFYSNELLNDREKVSIDFREEDLDVE